MRVRAVAVVIEDDDVLVIARRKNGREYCVLPGGGVEPGEQLRHACLRELREETGLEGEILRPLPVAGVPDEDAVYFHVSVRSRRLRLGGPESQRDEPTNRYEPVWVPIAELKGLVPASAHEAVRAARSKTG